jgi:heme-degrading monooxygenase HmoA
MVMERSEIQVREGEEEACARMLAERGAPLLRGVPGVRSVQWGRGVEAPNKVLLLVEWDDLAAHQAYNGTEASGELRRLLGAYAVGGAMEHFEMQ